MGIIFEELHGSTEKDVLEYRESKEYEIATVVVMFAIISSILMFVGLFAMDARPSTPVKVALRAYFNFR